MPSVNPPSAWIIKSPLVHTWGADIDRNETGSKSGANAIEFLATAPGGAPVLLESSQAFHIEPFTIYAIQASINADVNAGGDDILLDFEEYDAADVFLIGSSLHFAPSVGVGAYELIGGIVVTGSTARLGRLTFGKASASLVNVLFDSVDIFKLPRHSDWDLGVVALPGGVWTPVPILQAVLLPVAGYTAGGVGIVNVEEPGLYLVTADGEMLSPGPNNHVALRVTFTAGIVAPEVRTGTRISGMETGGVAFLPKPVVSAQSVMQGANGTILIEAFCNVAVTFNVGEMQITKLE